jgi:hypothetical protein
LDRSTYLRDRPTTPHEQQGNNKKDRGVLVEQFTYSSAPLRMRLATSSEYLQNKPKNKNKKKRRKRKYVDGKGVGRIKIN